MKKSMLHDLFVMEVQDLYDAEQQLLDALPKMVEAANNQDLKSALQNHLMETEEQAEKLQQLADELEFDLEGEPCAGMEGIVLEGEQVLEMDLEDLVRDLALIGAAQRVEHYEMAGYGTAVTLAEQMGHEQADLLQEILDQEENADKKLTKLAMMLYDQVPD